MHLTEFTDYSIRVLIYLHLNNNKKATIKNIAEYYDISRNHLVKVVHNLSTLGYIKSEKGKGGGIRLGKAPNEINIGELVVQVEPNFNLVGCFNSSGPQCKIEGVCSLKMILRKATTNFINELKQYSLADAVRNDKLDTWPDNYFVKNQNA